MITSKVYGHYHELVNRYGIFVSQCRPSFFVDDLSHRVPLLEQEPLTLLKHMTLTLFFLLMLMLLNLFFLYSIFFVFLSFFFWPLCRLFFNLRLLITPLVSSNVSYNENMTHLMIYAKNKLDSQNTTDKRFKIYLILHWDTIILHWDTIKIVSMLEMKNNNRIF